MEPTTLVDNRRHLGKPHRHPTSHREGRRTTTSRPSVAPVAPSRAPAAAAPSSIVAAMPRPQAEGRVYRPPYLPPSLHVALVALYLLVLAAGIALGVALAHYPR